MRRVQAVPLIGGPRNGQLYQSATRWPMYLTSQLHTMVPSTGDRILQGRSRQAGCYVQERTEGKISGYRWHA